MTLLLWQHLFCNGHLHVSIAVKNTDGVDRDHLVKKSLFRVSLLRWSCRDVSL